MAARVGGGSGAIISLTVALTFSHAAEDKAVRVKNECRYPIDVAVFTVSYFGDNPGACNNDVEEDFGDCITGFHRVEPGETTGTLQRTEMGYVYHYAYLPDLDVDYTWYGTDLCLTIQGASCEDGNSGCFCFREVGRARSVIISKSTFT
jgi:hypothetical protein